MLNLDVINAGLLDYEEGLKLQQLVWNDVLELKRPSTIIFCEHPPIYTFGKSAKSDNLLVNAQQLELMGAKVQQTDRGGDITFHGPGQLVGYPIVNLENYQLGVRRYVDLLEDALIEACSEFNVKADKLEGLTGIWVNAYRKIAAIGIKVSRGITMHGFALNVNTDLNYFNHMVPCGIKEKSVTSIKAETNQVLSLSEVASKFTTIFNNKLLQNESKFEG